jgi:hypothetical protein
MLSATRPGAWLRLVIVLLLVAVALAVAHVIFRRRPNCARLNLKCWDNSDCGTHCVCRDASASSPGLCVAK